MSKRNQPSRPAGSRADQNHHANQQNPNNPAHQANRDNRSNQLNPDHPAYLPGAGGKNQQR